MEFPKEIWKMWVTVSWLLPQLGKESV
jgi:hypothetical protein